MVHVSMVAPAAVPFRLDHSDASTLDAAIRLAGPFGKFRTLIIAEHGLELMCRLIRYSCPAATVMKKAAKPAAGDFDLVLALPGTLASEALVAQAQRALGPHGRLVAGVADGGAASLARLLRLNGFAGLYIVHLPRLVLLRAELRRTP